MGILAVIAFAVFPVYHTPKGKIPGQLMFSRDLIIPISYIYDYILIREDKQKQIDIGVILENNTMIDYYYIVRDKVLLKINRPKNMKPHSMHHMSLPKRISM